MNTAVTTRELGASGLHVSTLCLGANVFGWTADEAASFAVLDAFTDAGLNFIDTADVYSRWIPGHQGGESETIIGKWLKRTGKRDKVVIATKLGFEMGEDKKGLSKKYMFEAVEASLTRLQTDYIDLYQSHTDDQETPLEETLGAYGELIEQGKIRAIGASNYKADRLEQAFEVSLDRDLPRYECLQPHYNLIERALFEPELEPVCLKHGIGVIPYFGLAAGFLTGKYRSEEDLKQSPRGGRAKSYLNDRGFQVLKALDQVAEAYRTKPARVALAWLIARPSITAPIASATSVKQLEDLVAATRLALDEDSIQLLDQASA